MAANEYDISAGLVPIDNSTGATANSYYISAGLVPIDSSVEIVGTTCWGHVTAVWETNKRTFSGNWTGTGTASGSGDSETLDLDAGEYMVSEVVNTGAQTIKLLQNNYAAGDTGTLKYRTGATSAACQAADWIAYTVPFASDGYVQVRVEN